MKIIYTPRALHDNERILAHIHERNPRAAHNVSLAIEHAIGMCDRSHGARLKSLGIVPDEN